MYSATCGVFNSLYITVHSQTLQNGYSFHKIVQRSCINDRQIVSMRSMASFRTRNSSLPVHRNLQNVLRTPLADRSLSNSNNQRAINENLAS